MNAFTYIVISLLGLKVVVELFLEWLNRTEVKANASAVPEIYRGIVDRKTYDKAVRYTLAKNGVNLFDTVYSSIWLYVFLVSGLLPIVYYGLTDFLSISIWGQSLVLFLMGMVLSLPSLPIDVWNTFRVESRYGFNRTSVGLWISDKFKGLVLGLVIAYPLLCLLLWLFEVLPNTWWLFGFVAFWIVQILMLLLYPRLILPLFNKLSPLPEGSLQERLMRLGERTGFTAKTIQVIDGSKRSGHSNAFFTGFGRFRRIVLFDTLIEQLEPQQLEAVLAHEIGHYKKRHIPKMLIMSTVMSFIGFACIGWLVDQAWFFSAFGFSISNGMVPALILFLLVSGLFTFWLSPFMSALSRKHEYEADAFAREAMGGDPQPLVESLRKMHEKNLGNLTPHPLFSAFHYSHPTIIEREQALCAEQSC